ncbi:AraC family transcriptional regulator [Paenibacillus sp. FSL H7-0357]|uniref:AraC family transcriptional regulator n=1 Tax=Paenibacillus sp. FSL H7-0357 TaxID=1536774 RepID=UPI0004F7AB89|nr:AraC family transcriptional regulator [Paenibacillus sp. FSL H7-0357]AIQ17998.1 AraC family transcriptional regulator [Paenibacillus sp. FSL H7-0357]
MNQTQPEEELSLERQKELASLIERHTRTDGKHLSAIPSLHLFRASCEQEPQFAIYEPALCMIAQGSKLVMLAKEGYRYDPRSYLLASVHLPIKGQILEATAIRPYLGLQLNFQPDQIVDMLQMPRSGGETGNHSSRGLAVGSVSSSLLDAVIRLIRLLDNPEDIEGLAPLMIREILYRVMQGEQGASIKSFVVSGSHAQRIAAVIDRINRDYRQRLQVHDLAKMVNMSVSSLHYYFKEVTAMSPLQYLKQVRLQEARRLLLSETTEAAEAAFQVGYESPSQFSREYARLFGQPPIRDVNQLRHRLSRS